MKISRKRVAALAILSTATVLQLPTGLSGGCGQFGAQLLAGVFDACSVFNCTSGTFFNLCTPTRLLVDCPGEATNGGGDETP